MNSHRGEIEIDLDKPRKFKMSNKAIVLIEQKLEKPIQKILDKDMGVSEVSYILWAGLVGGGDKDLTWEEALEIMDEKPLEFIVNKLEGAFNTVFQKGSEAGKN